MPVVFGWDNSPAPSLEQVGSRAALLLQFSAFPENLSSLRLLQCWPGDPTLQTDPGWLPLVAPPPKIAFSQSIQVPMGFPLLSLCDFPPSSAGERKWNSGVPSSGSLEPGVRKDKDGAGSERNWNFLLRILPHRAGSWQGLGWGGRRSSWWVQRAPERGNLGIEGLFPLDWEDAGAK